jgi:DNA polymerase zeta
MRAELKLSSYSRQNVALHLLHETVPFFSDKQLNRWYKKVNTRHLTVQYVTRLALLNLRLVDKLDLFRRTSESARLYRIDFFSVLTRGSQYRVEASLARYAHLQDYLLITPSKKQVANQAPMSVIPLVLEPSSQFYESPVVVLDFQALYPSMIIAYNLCYSTIIAKLKSGIGTISINSNHNNQHDHTDDEKDCMEKLGVIAYPEVFSAAAAYSIGLFDGFKPKDTNSSPCHNEDSKDTRKLDGTPFVTPNGCVFVPKNVRLGILPQMLKEILDTRFMVKRAMKRYANPPGDGDNNLGYDYDVLRRVLDARQLSIKLLANVTYGYTAAGFSGRMPMAELADSVVQLGRSTLEWAIRVIKTTKKWNAEVVYGDTDSIFVHLPGLSL